MNFLRFSWKICLGVLIGFGLGVVLFHTPTTKAQSRGAFVTVQQVPVLELRSTLQSEGSQVVGFSCVGDLRGNVCFVASVR